MITPELKDAILVSLTSSNSMKLVKYFDRDISEFNVHPDVYEAIILQFNKIGLLTATRFANPRGFSITLSADAFDFVSHGGFVAQEKLLRNNLEKLNLELQQLSKELEPNFLEKANSISSIASAITSALGLIRG